MASKLVQAQAQGHVILVFLAPNYPNHEIIQADPPLRKQLFCWTDVSQVDSAYVLDIADADIALLPKGDNVIGDGKSNPLDDDIPDSSSAKTPT